MISVMGIKARHHGIDINGTKADIVKEMGVNPRHINAIRINIYFPQNYSEKERELLERTAHTCPVGNSLNENLEEDITFHYPH